MAGHSKWSQVKHSKGPLDLKRGQLFQKLARKITPAATTGSGSPGGNPRCRTAIFAAENPAYFPESCFPIADEPVTAQVLHLIDALEDSAGMHNAHLNFDAPEEVFAKLSA